MTLADQLLAEELPLHTDPKHIAYWPDSKTFYVFDPFLSRVAAGLMAAYGAIEGSGDESFKLEPLKDGQVEELTQRGFTQAKNIQITVSPLV